jgi:hypothetical protein
MAWRGQGCGTGKALQKPSSPGQVAGLHFCIAISVSPWLDVVQGERLTVRSCQETYWIMREFPDEDLTKLV